MAYQDLYRLSVHAVILNEANQVLMLKTTYGQMSWTFPGGAVDLGETVHDTLIRECREELGLEIEIRYLSGIYYSEHHQSHALMFSCTIPSGGLPKLSDEHSEFRFFDQAELKESHRKRVLDCLSFNGNVVSGKI